MTWQIFAIFAACCSAKAGSFGLHRLQGRKPARSASSRDAKKLTFIGFAKRAAQDGLQ